ncbi:hypothetical protein JW935_15390 [candidate division KSB1 bacterium]|nr:hypothetical protein [candidate division KSB1 bacterium]
MKKMIILLLGTTTFLFARDVLPPCVNISNERPFFLLQAPALHLESAETTAQDIIQAWEDSYPNELEPYSAMEITSQIADINNRIVFLDKLLSSLGEKNIPVVLQIAAEEKSLVLPLVLVEKFLQKYPIIKGIAISHIQLKNYSSFGGDLIYKLSTETEYTIDAIKLAARFGRYTFIRLDELYWLHLAADELQTPLLNVMQEYHEYVIAQNLAHPPFFITRQCTVMGLWLSDVVDNFGVTAQSYMWQKCGFLEPGKFGVSEQPLPSFYRPLLLQNALTGGTVYSIDPAEEIWDKTHGNIGETVIFPTLLQIIRHNIIPGKSQVLAKARVAFQMQRCSAVKDFQFHINDIDAIAGTGFLYHAAYGTNDFSHWFDIIPDESRYYYIPIVPQSLTQKIKSRFANILVSGDFKSAKDYEKYLNQEYKKSNSGSAFVTSLNNAVYVLHSYENRYEEQDYQVTVPQWVDMPTVQVSIGRAKLSWKKVPKAANYRIYRLRDPGKTFSAYQFTPVAYVQTNNFEAELPKDGSVAYAVSATTSQKKTLKGKLNYPDSYVFSTVESPLVNVVELDIQGQVTRHNLYENTGDRRLKTQKFWPTYHGAPQNRIREAKQVERRLDGMIKSYNAGDWQSVSNFYSPAYKDRKGAGRDFIAAALKWWFSRFERPTAVIQALEWDFSDYETKQLIRVQLWIRFHAVDFHSADRCTVTLPTGESRVWFTFKTDLQNNWVILFADPGFPDYDDLLTLIPGNPKTSEPKETNE